MHNIKTTSLGIILHRGLFVLISAFLLFLVSEVGLACGKKNALFFSFLAFFSVFAILPQLKTFSKNFWCAIILVRDTTFMPTLTFLGLLSPEIGLSFGEKNSHPHRHSSTQTYRHPFYFTIRETLIDRQTNRQTDTLHYRMIDRNRPRSMHSMRPKGIVPGL